jgi:uncharacterized protein YndB with AHSA1/START domain
MIGEDSAGAEAPERTIVVTRTFDAPRDLVFRAWTRPEFLARWLGQGAFPVDDGEVDLRPGGIVRCRMRAPDGRDVTGTLVWREVVAPERIVFVSSFADEEGNPVRHPLRADRSLEVLNTVTFAERDGRTTLTTWAVALPSAEPRRAVLEPGHA